MAIQTVNVGTTPNDGTGDPARTAFTKLNDNFTAAENAASRLVATTAEALAGTAGVVPDAEQVRAVIAQDVPNLNAGTVTDGVYTVGDQTIAGIKTFSSFPVSPSAEPTADYQMANKKYVDDVIASQTPSMTGSITLNGTTNNTVVVTDIVTELGLETGDVIRIDTGAYNKLHTVESITNNGSIIVNYEHAGNRGNGSLKLTDFTGQATVTRIAKWFNAPIGLGQAWLEVTRINGVSYSNDTRRAISSMIGFIASGSWNASITIGSVVSPAFFGLCIEIPNNENYKWMLSGAITGVKVLELR